MDAHDHVGAGPARAQGYRDRVGVTRERRTVLVNGSPPGIEGGPPADLFRRQPQDPLGAGVRRLQPARSEEHTSELQSRLHLVCRLLLEKKKKKKIGYHRNSQEAIHLTSPHTTG